MLKAETLVWDELERFINNGNVEIINIFQECEIHTNSRGDKFWTENFYRYRVVYKE